MFPWEVLFDLPVRPGRSDGVHHWRRPAVLSSSLPSVTLSSDHSSTGKLWRHQRWQNRSCSYPSKVFASRWINQSFSRFRLDVAVWDLYIRRILLWDCITSHTTCPHNVLFAASRKRMVKRVMSNSSIILLEPMETPLTRFLSSFTELSELFSPPMASGQTNSSFGLEQESAGSLVYL